MNGSPPCELSARSELASRLKAKQLVGVNGDALAYRTAWRYPETASPRDGPPGQGVHMNIPSRCTSAMQFCPTFGMKESLARCFASGRPAESAGGLPAQSPSLLCETSHKTMQVLVPEK